LGLFRTEVALSGAPHANHSIENRTLVFMVFDNPRAAIKAAAQAGPVKKYDNKIIGHLLGYLIKWYGFEGRRSAGMTMRRDDRRKSGRRMWRVLRWCVQAMMLSLFVALFFLSPPDSPVAASAFFRFDPLAGMASMMASREWIAGMALGAITLALTVLLGRIWCGWICPLGTLIDWVPSRKARFERLQQSPPWRFVKYALLFALLTGALFGNLGLVWLDPITLLFRGGAATRAWAMGHPFNQTFIVLLLLVLAGNAIHSRFWCRDLCPLGALLALVAKFCLIRHRVAESKCVSCRQCATTCPMGAIDPGRGYKADPAECSVCMVCTERCAVAAVTFQRLQAPLVLPEFEPERRRLILSMGAGVAAFAVVKNVPLATGSYKESRTRERPPGATRESLESKCIRCGMCLNVCPVNVLRPMGKADDPPALWTPARVGDCEPGCTACREVCPTGAIPSLGTKKV
jgi:polyferredoxin